MELEEEIKDIKKEIIESRNLVIKTDNLVKNLSADIKAIAKKQESYEKKYIFTSVAAYLIFVALIGTGAYFFMQSRVEKLSSENEELKKKDSGVKSTVAELESKLKTKEQASRQALLLYNELKAGSSEQALAQFDRLAGRGLTELEQVLLGDLVAKKRKDLAQGKYEEGKKLFGHKDYEKAEAAFRTAVKNLGKTKDPMLTDLYFDLGITLHRLKKYSDSTGYLERMLQRSTDANKNGEAAFTIGQSFELSAQLDKAKEAYLKFLQYYPKHKWKGIAKAKLRKLQQVP
jgi:TolA-binding protein